MDAMKKIFLTILVCFLAAGSLLIAGAFSSEAADDAGMRLIGTAVVDGAPSIAFVQLISGTRFVREGEEILDGVRLVKVLRNRIDVERGGRHQEIRSDSNAAGIGVPAGPDMVATAGADVDRLWETQGRTGRSLFYSHYRRSQN
jgi:hypothetical protein